MRTVACLPYPGGLPPGREREGLPVPWHCGKADPSEHTNMSKNITLPQLGLREVELTPI